jgi:hypothetical protein
VYSARGGRDSSEHLSPRSLASPLGSGEVETFRDNVFLKRGLLDRSTTRYFFKRPKTSPHKPTGNLHENLFSGKCAFQNYLLLFK